jgi:signal transduction histidine kinase
MGSLLASVAHELNNPLSIILLHTDLLQGDAGSGSLAEYAAEIAQAARRCEWLVRQLLTVCPYVGVLLKTMAVPWSARVR